MANDATSKTLTIDFGSAAAAEAFKVWLCESGEQGYWDHMNCQDVAPEVIVRSFNYQEANRISTTMQPREGS